jgi:hypothetical protein
MPYCPKCKVSLADDATYCPLCLSPSAESLVASAAAAASSAHERVSVAETIRNAESEARLSGPERRKLVMELLTVSLSLILVITLSIDAILVRSLSWSRFVAIILVSSWLFSFMPLLFWGHPWRLLAALGPALPIALFLWGVCVNDLSWFLPVGLPIVLFLEAVTVTVLTLIGVMRQRGLNIPAVILVGLGLLCVGIDATLNRYVFGAIGLSWSFVVAVSVCPVAGLFMYLHYRVLKKASLRKLFRL